MSPDLQVEHPAQPMAVFQPLWEMLRSQPGAPGWDLQGTTALPSPDQPPCATNSPRGVLQGFP